MKRRLMHRVVLLAFLVTTGAPLATVRGQPSQSSTTDTLASAVGTVDVQKAVGDSEIGRRLKGILEATGRFPNLSVSVREGVVFLDGLSASKEDRDWAGDLSRNTEGVAAVMNRLDVAHPSIWNFEPAIEGIREFAREIIQAIPFVVIAILVIIGTIAVARLVTMLARKGMQRRTTSQLLRDVVARGSGVLVVLAGLFLIFRVAGLTTIALTVVGGTGVLGIILGIAFREISENLLASVFLSVQHPFRNGDLVEIQGVTGYVQRLMMRATLLMTLDGNHVQIPNSTVYKSVIRNFTSNPNRREDFVIGIGYDDSVPEAQAAAVKVLADHPAVLKDPEPWVLVDALGSATVNLKVYFWLDGSKHSWLKVRSSVIRLVKRAFQDRGISMPDEARELIFPKGVPVTIRHDSIPSESLRKEPSPEAHAEDVATDAEAGLRSDAGEIEQQARSSRVPEEGADLLKNE